MPNFQVFRHFPVHLSIGPFITELVKYIDEEVYPGRFKFKMVGPGDKSIQRIEEEKRDDRELQATPLPSLVVTPVIDEPTQEWFQMWNTRRLVPRLGSLLSSDLYSTEEFRIAYVTRRITGHAEIVIATKSYMEVHDIMMAFYDQFYNLNTWIILPEINLYFVLPDDLVFYTEDGGRISIDWADTRLSKQLVRSVNKEWYLYPIRHHPYIRLTSLTDASDLYGGADSVPLYGLTGTIEFEMDLPSYLTIETDYLVKEIESSIMIGSKYFSKKVFDYIDSPVIIRDDYVYYPQKRYYIEFENDTLSGYTLTLEHSYVEHQYEYIFFTENGELYENVNYTYASPNLVVFNEAFPAGTFLEYVYCKVSKFK